MAVVRTERGLDRLVNFSDATVAIAITLLILPLVDQADDAAADIGAWLRDNYWELIAFAISFIVIARFWITHHRIFEWVVSYDVRIIWLNFLWLASIVVMPFTTNVLAASQSGQPAVYALYIGNMLVASVSMQFITIVLRRSPALVRDDAKQEMDAAKGWYADVLMLLALIFAVIFPHVGIWWLFLLFLQGPLMGLTKALRRRPGANS
ncbi:TMEM175 family protein [Leifsonia sp. NPDC058194]|uniref:TMEM175 family protein n=1 Tax=Leifsonia sp. NPDC058194 TaxID=3346374 RepID=UPI0036DC67F7